MVLQPLYKVSIAGTVAVERSPPHNSDCGITLFSPSAYCTVVIGAWITLLKWLKKSVNKTAR